MPDAYGAWTWEPLRNPVLAGLEEGGLPHASNWDAPRREEGADCPDEEPLRVAIGPPAASEHAGAALSGQR